MYMPWTLHVQMVTDHHLGGIKIRSVGKLYTIRLGAKESFQYLCDKLGPWISCQRAQLHKCVCVAHYIMLTFTTCTIATTWIRYWLPSVAALGCCCWPYIQTQLSSSLYLLAFSHSSCCLSCCFFNISCSSFIFSPPARQICPAWD